jgi:hypothetical protein
MARSLRSMIPLRLDRWTRLLWHAGQLAMANLLVQLLSFRVMVPQGCGDCLSRFVQGRGRLRSWTVDRRVTFKQMLEVK